MNFWPDGSLADEKSVGELFASRITILLIMRWRVFTSEYTRNPLSKFLAEMLVRSEIASTQSVIVPSNFCPLANTHRHSYLKPNSLP